MRSQILVNDVESVVSRCTGGKSNYVGVRTIRNERFVILASRFIENAAWAKQQGGRVQMLYHFSTTTLSHMMQFSHDELCPLASLSSNAEAAYTYCHPNMILSSIQQNSEFDPDSAKSNRLGWIVVAVEHNLNVGERRVKISSGYATIRRLENAADCLPLVCFDASLRNNDIIRRLLNGASFFVLGESDSFFLINELISSVSPSC